MSDSDLACVRRWTDEQTGREVRLLTRPGDANRISLPYFMTWKHLADGRLLCADRVFDPVTGEAVALPDVGQPMQVSADGRCVFCWDADGRTVLALAVADLAAKPLGRLPDELTFDRWFMTCDARTLVGWRFHELGQDLHAFAQPSAEKFWRFFSRPRRAELWACELETGRVATLVVTENLGIIYVVPSPTDPTLVKFCHDDHEARCQRIWTVRTDGTELCAVRPQQAGEVVTHDIWWPDGRFIGYKYLDRRNDRTLMDVPLSEYAPVPTRIGLAQPNGPEVYLSDPLESYHSHVNVSRDGTLISGEGTHDRPFLYAAAFSPKSTRIDFIPQATIHTPYSPMGGHGLQADFTADGRWLLYQDTIEGESHVCAVRVEI